jgi:hypothetical protein
MSHTPGPWAASQILDDGRWGIVTNPPIEPRMIPDSLIVVGVNRNLTKENADLIAAAPELLDGLRHMRWCASCADGRWEDCDGGRAALDAIAKATGESESEAPKMAMDSEPKA